MAALSLSGVTKRFGATVAVDALDLAIGDGEFISFLGPSGCGKTTTLNMIAGLETPTAGTIRIGERDVTRLPAMHRDVAMVFQSYALYPHMTVARNLGFALEVRGIARADIATRVRRAADMLGLGEYLTRYPRQLSGGQRQRVALGRALVRDPEVFLLDEPLSNLDAVLRVETRAELKQLFNRLATTAIYVTHDQAEAMTMSDRIAVFRSGRLQQVDTPLGIYRNPANRFVASFVGSPPMSFVKGELRAADTIALLGDTFGLPARVAIAGDSGRPLDVGLRVEDVALDPEGTLRMKVELVEHLGSLMIVHLSKPGSRLLAQAGASERYRAGDVVGVRLQPHLFHLFDPDTGIALATPALAAA